MYGYAAEIGAVAARHVAAEMETELFAPWSAEKRGSLERGLAVAGRRRLEAYPQEIAAARSGGVHPASSRPTRHEMEVPPKIEVPRRQNDIDHIHQRAAEQQRECRLRQATGTSTALGPDRVLETAHGSISLPPEPGWLCGGLLTRVQHAGRVAGCEIISRCHHDRIF